MEEKNNINLEAEDYRQPITYGMYREMEARHEHKHKVTVIAFTIALVISMLIGFADDLHWRLIFSQYDISSEEITVETTDEGHANLLGEGANVNGVINNGNENNNKAQDDDQERQVEE